MRLIAITSEQEVPGEAKAVNQMLRIPEVSLHVRKPSWNIEKISKFLNEIDENMLPKVVVHAQPEWQEYLTNVAVNCRFRDLKRFTARRRLSCSVHSWWEFSVAQPYVDYCLVSPFFNSISKNGYQANIDLWNIPADADRQKIAALGGICEGNIAKLKETGISAAAVLGAVWKSGDPVKNVQRILKAYDETVHSVYSGL